jgi:L-asparaginase
MIVIYVVTTGGTIEKAYCEQTRSVASPNNKIECYLQLLRLPDSEVNVVPLFNEDSFRMTSAHREAILAAVRGLLNEEAPIIITHGTDTIVETSLFLKQALPEVKIPIVLTGAMMPLGFEGSDGLQNLTESLFAVRLLSPGVFIVMHNQVFPVVHMKDHKPWRFAGIVPEPA